MLQNASGRRHDVVGCDRNKNYHLNRASIPSNLIKESLSRNEAEVGGTEPRCGYVPSSDACIFRDPPALLDSKNILQVVLSSDRLWHRTRDTGNFDVLQFSTSHNYSQIGQEPLQTTTVLCRQPSFRAIKATLSSQFA